MRSWSRLLAASLSVMTLLAVLSGGCTLTRSGDLAQQCTTAAECELPNPCYVAECTTSAQCVFTPTDNTAVLPQVADDCARWQCVIDGETAEPQLLDAPDDRPADVECVTRYSCASGELEEFGVGPGTLCGAFDQGVCEDGTCNVGCDGEGDPRCDDGNACTVDLCDTLSNTCVYENIDNVAAPEQVDGDCRVVLCTLGVETENYDDLDVFDDGSECTVDSCNSGQPVNAPVPQGTACTGTDPDASVCDAMGACVQCNADVECIGFMNGWDDTDCQTPQCVAGVCELACEPLGVVAANQSPTPDCQVNVCDGQCGYQDNVDDSDVPIDVNPCTQDFCSFGVPQHPPEPADTACGGGSICDGNGNCGGCNDDGDCPSDTFCIDWSCDTTQVTNQCVSANLNDGLDLPTGQMDGDCHTLRCNAGVIEDQIDDSDLRIDNLECTNDVCTAGVPTNPPRPVDDACSEGADGRFCDGNGACVNCTNVSQCNLADGECDQDLCSANTCVIDFFPDTVNAPMNCQSGMPDCQVVRCDGMGECGASVPDDADVVDDGLECTADSCSGGAEVHDATVLEGTACTQNGVFCDGIETCQSGACLVDAANPACPGTNVGPNCNDSCDEGTATCTAPDIATTSCDDGQFCTGTETCDGLGTCVATGNPCPGQDVGPACNDSCQELGGGTGDCNGADAGTTSCDDGQFCTTTDTCNGSGSCVGAGNPCPGHDVGPACNDSCQELGGGAGDCLGDDSAITSCNDGQFCTATDTCDGSGSCLGVGNPCPGHDVGPACNDSCQELGGGAGDCAANDSNTTSCDDGLFCTGTETCDGGGMCVATGDPCDGVDGDADCSEICNEGADDCSTVDPNATDCGGGNVCIDDVCSDVRLVFVTSTTFDGDDWGNALGADAACAARATAAGLPGTFMAWVSDAATSPSVRFTQSSVPYVMRDGTTVADDYTDLTDGTLDANIDVDESGVTVAASSVWTGTTDAGVTATDTCLDWVTVMMGDVGAVGSTSSSIAGWSDGTTQTCDTSHRLFCFEQ